MQIFSMEKWNLFTKIVEEVSLLSSQYLFL